MNSKVIIIGILVILFIIILLQNTHMITLNFLFWEINTSAFYIPVVILLSIGAGFLITRFKKNKNKKDDLDY